MLVCMLPGDGLQESFATGNDGWYGGCCSQLYFADRRTPSRSRFASEVVDFGQQVSSSLEPLIS